jgi:hypothetical protein
MTYNGEDPRPEELDDSELEKEAEREGARPGDPLSEQIMRRWDPTQLLRLVSSRAGRGERLDESTRRKYESRLGVDLGDVRIFTGEFAEAVTRAHSAEAVTVGGTGMIMMGQTANRSKATSAGERLLTHELTHVAQGKRDRSLRGPQPRGYGGATPLATEEHEEEAEAAEAADAAGEGPAGEQQADQGEKMQKLFTRVVQILEEEERIYELRNGLPRYRP